MKKTVIKEDVVIREPKPSPVRAILFLIFAAALTACDQWIKLLVLADEGLKNGQKYEVIPGFFNIAYTYNTGAAWSFLADKPWGIHVLTAISAVASLIFIFFVIKKSGWPFFLPFSLSLILAGTAGNLIDRFYLQGVVDYLDFVFGSWHFPTFNLADSLIVIGVIFLAIYLLFFEHKHKSRFEIEQKHKVRPLQ